MSHQTLYDEDRNVSHLRGTLPENKFKAHIVESTVVAIVFWDIEGNWLVDFLKNDATINSEMRTDIKEVKTKKSKGSTKQEDKSSRPA